MQNEYPAHRHGPGIFGWVIIAIVALAVIGIFVSPFLWGYSGVTMPMNGNYPMFFGGWFFWPFGILIFFFLIFGVFRWFLFPWGRGGYYGRRWSMYGAPEEILRRRYARGEITKDQFDQMMRDLQQER